MQINKTGLIAALVAVVIITGIIVIKNSKSESIPKVQTNTPVTQQQPTIEEPNTPEIVTTGEVKEFAFDSYYAPAEKRAYFSVTDITVNKGDTVRFKVTNTFGTHNVKIDEFNVFAETPLNQTTVVEFVADKAGEFVYYCSKPGHRESGQWGTLKVLE